jgi:hypothetical protein
MEKFIVCAACCQREICARFFAGKNGVISGECLFENFFLKALMTDVI